MATPFRALTSTSQVGRLAVLKSECHVCPAVSQTPTDQPDQYQPFVAIWDTGATNSAIAQRVVDTCGLKATGMADVQHADGVTKSPTFLVNIRLPNGVAFQGVVVTLAKLAGADMVIGMDIVARGDFAVTNVGDITTFSYRYPSIKKIDYVEEARQLQQQAAAQKPRPPFYEGFRQKKKHK